MNDMVTAQGGVRVKTTTTTKSQKNVKQNIIKLELVTRFSNSTVHTFVCVCVTRCDGRQPNQRRLLHSSSIPSPHSGALLVLQLAHLCNCSCQRKVITSQTCICDRLLCCYCEFKSPLFRILYYVFTLCFQAGCLLGQGLEVFCSFSPCVSCLKYCSDLAAPPGTTD